MKDGKVIERILTPLVVEEKISAIVWSFRDITESRKVLDLEESLIEKSKIIQEINRYN
jgi:hypothetical protein